MYPWTPFLYTLYKEWLSNYTSKICISIYRVFFSGMQAKYFPMEGEMERKGKYLESETLFFLPFQPLLSMFPYAHKCTIWVSIQIGFSIFHLLNQENRHVRNVLYSVYLVSFREVYPSEKKKQKNIFLPYVNTAPTDMISCSAQLVPQSRYLTV